MMQVHPSLLKGKWGANRQTPNVKGLPVHVDVACSKCGKDMVGIKLSWTRQPSNSRLQWTMATCTNCKKQHHVFLMAWDANADDANQPGECFIWPASRAAHRDSDMLSKVSPNFLNIWKQAHEAEQRGLSEVAGPAYRKALEFLVKDYLIQRDGEEHRRAISEDTLGNCIVNRLGDEDIAESAKHASWLGNDQVHYLTKHTGHDMQDLKALIDACASHLATKANLARINTSMSEKGG